MLRQSVRGLGVLIPRLPFSISLAGCPYNSINTCYTVISCLVLELLEQSVVSAATLRLLRFA